MSCKQCSLLPVAPQDGRKLTKNVDTPSHMADVFFRDPIGVSLNTGGGERQRSAHARIRVLNESTWHCPGVCAATALQWCARPCTVPGLHPGVGYQEVRGVTVSLAGERGPPPIPWLGGLIHRCSVSLSNYGFALDLGGSRWGGLIKKGIREYVFFSYFGSGALARVQRLLPIGAVYS